MEANQKVKKEKKLDLKKVMKVFSLEKTYLSIIEKYQIKDLDWYFSAEGKKEYEKAETKLQKIEYFRKYLISLICVDDKIKKLFTSGGAKVKNGNDLIKNFAETSFRIAYVLVDAVEGTSISYGKYPDILKKEANPIINAVVDDPLAMLMKWNDVKGKLGETLLEALVGQGNNPIYERLTTDSKKPEYKIERTIITLFSYEDKLFSPYALFRIKYDFN